MYRALASSVSGSGPSRDAESTIRGLTQDFCTAFNTGNFDHAAALFAPEAVLMPPHREWSQGIRAIERVLQEFGDTGYESLRFDTVRVDASGDMAIESGLYTVAIRRGSAIVSDRGKYVRAWRRLGAWLIIADCWSSNLPLADSAQADTGAKVA
jgi:uncharacterized protein (TIGR02246 family)